MAVAMLLSLAAPAVAQTVPDPLNPVATHYVMLTPVVAANWNATIKVKVLDQFGEPLSNQRVGFTVRGGPYLGESCVQELQRQASELIVRVPDSYYCPALSQLNLEAYSDSKGVASVTYSRDLWGQDVVSVRGAAAALVTWSSQGGDPVEIPSEEPSPPPAPTPPDPVTPTPTHYVMLTPVVAAHYFGNATIKVLVLDQFGEPLSNQRVGFTVTGDQNVDEQCADEYVTTLGTSADYCPVRQNLFLASYSDGKGVAQITYSRPDWGHDTVYTAGAAVANVTWSSQETNPVEVPSEEPTPQPAPTPPPPPDPLKPVATHYVMLTPIVAALIGDVATVKVLVLDQFGGAVTNHKVTFLVTGTTEITQNCVAKPLEYADELVVRPPDTQYCPRQFLYFDAYTDSKGVAVMSYRRDEAGEDIVSAGRGEAAVTWNYSEEATVELPTPGPLPSPTPAPLPSPTAPTPGPLPSPTPAPLPSPTAPTLGPLPSTTPVPLPSPTAPSPEPLPSVTPQPLPSPGPLPSVTPQPLPTAPSPEPLPSPTAPEPEPVPSPTAPTPGPLPSPTPTGGGGTCEIASDGLYSCGSTAFRWHDLMGATSLSFSGDALSSAVPLPFAFNWYGQPKTQLYVSSNGPVCFTGAQECASYRAQSLPSAASPNDLAACFWEALDPSRAASVSYQTVGALPTRTLVIEFEGVPHDASLSTNSFQTHIHEDGSIDCMLKDISSDDDGASSVVGIEDATGELGVRYRFGEFSAQNVGISFEPASSVE